MMKAIEPFFATLVALLACLIHVLPTLWRLGEDLRERRWHVRQTVQGRIVLELHHFAPGLGGILFKPVFKRPLKVINAATMQTTGRR
ncbi:MAG TPA: hypothetical protein VL361_23025 [Candidatus Limnocylindrales bacterium]|jgi:hypothetical protein|nr:hypothetical protein [Candidatus Limnocylindrales bacterium]